MDPPFGLRSMSGGGIFGPRSRRDTGVTLLTRADLRSLVKISERGPDSDLVPSQESPS